MSLNKSINITDLLFDNGNLIQAYQILGVEKDVTVDYIKQLFMNVEQYELSKEQLKAFLILGVEENKKIYDTYLSYNKDKYEFKHNRAIEEHEQLMRELEFSICRHEEFEYNRLFSLLNTVSNQSHPTLFSNEYCFIARFIQDSTGGWYHNNSNFSNKGQIDILKGKDGYLYYIKQIGSQWIIFSSELFYDFNKPTTKNGTICRISDVAGKIKSNLNGYFWEIYDDGEYLTKIEYFQGGYDCNKYSPKNMPSNLDAAILRITGLKRKNIYTASLYTSKNNGENLDIDVSLGSFMDSSILGIDISKDISQAILTDIDKTNSSDIKQMKKYISRIPIL